MPRRLLSVNFILSFLCGSCVSVQSGDEPPLRPRPRHDNHISCQLPHQSLPDHLINQKTKRNFSSMPSDTTGSAQKTAALAQECMQKIALCLARPGTRSLRNIHDCPQMDNRAGICRLSGHGTFYPDPAEISIGMVQWTRPPQGNSLWGAVRPVNCREVISLPARGEKPFAPP